jgi:Glutamine synthetase, catalytic domain
VPRRGGTWPTRSAHDDSNARVTASRLLRAGDESTHQLHAHREPDATAARHAEIAARWRAAGRRSVAVADGDALLEARRVSGRALNARGLRASYDVAVPLHRPEQMFAAIERSSTDEGVSIPTFDIRPGRRRQPALVGARRERRGSTANPYLAFSALLQAGLDGIRNKIEPPDPIDKDLYELEPAEATTVKQVPGSLEAVLYALEADHGFLLEGGVFTQDLIETWLEYKRTKELDQIRQRPHPWEFMLYYDL